MNENKIILISGTSGVGKTTIAKLLLCYFGSDYSLIISGDDCHKWERNSKNWEKYTHLNPKANNIQQEYNSLFSLKNDYVISRKIYNHSNGLFDEEKTIEPKKNIIYEGLHSLYEKKIRDISYLKIYVDTDEELKIAWKINRDLNKRGYTEEQILKNIQRRMVDEQKYIIPQKEYADAIVKFTFNDSGVNFKYHTKNDTFLNFFESVKKIYDFNKQFVKICNLIAEDESLVQNKGGNISLKFNNKLMITSSGVNLSNISIFDGYCICENKKNIINSDKPSMEIDSHLLIDSKAIIHAHPVSLLTILCCEQSQQILEELYKQYNFNLIDYQMPGIKVANSIEKMKDSKIIFLKNHGVFIGAEDLESAFQLTKKIEKIAKDYVQKNFKEKTTIAASKEFLFPDSVIFEEKNRNLNNIILKNIIGCGLSPKFLSTAEINELLNSEEEKYRMRA